MTKKILTTIIIVIVIITMCFGMKMKSSYSDFISQDNYLEQLYVAEISDDIAKNECERMRKELTNMPIIIRVKAIGEIEHLFHVDRQKVEVCEIYKGSGLENREEIYLYSDNWRLILDGEPNSIQRGFVNLMKINDEYLVFCKTDAEISDAGIPILHVCSDYYITPVFGYGSYSNIIIPVKGDTTYVKYADVVDNEFFAASEEALNSLEILKSDLLTKYPIQ